MQVASPELHILIHSAGGHFFKRTCTANGIEVNFATNYLSKFLLTNLLLPRLISSAPARIVVVGSPVVDPRRWLTFPGLYSSTQFPLRAFLHAGLATAVWTTEVARQLVSSGVTITNVNPGIVHTNIGRTWPAPLRVFDQILQELSGVSAEDGAVAPVYLATAPELAGVNGQFFHKMACVHVPSSTYDIDLARHLWAFSEQLVGQTFSVAQPAVQKGLS